MKLFIPSEKQLGHLRLGTLVQQIVDLPKVVNFPKNPGLPEEELNKIGFVYNYEIIHT